MATPRAAAARATASSPSGCTACTPVGDMRTGMAISWPITTVACSRLGDRPAMWGAKPSSPKAATLSARVRPRSDPARMARCTERGRRFSARRSASATDSNHSLPISPPRSGRSTVAA